MSCASAGSAGSRPTGRPSSRRCRLGLPATLGLNCAASCCCNTIRARSPCRAWWANSGRSASRSPSARSAQRGGPFVEGAGLRAGLETAPWISVDDTGARHRHRYCTQIGNDHFAASKSRLNFLEVLRAGYADYVINAEAYMRQRALAGPVIKALAGHPDRHFADEAAWRDHLRRLGITDLEVNPDPVRIATEGALWGAIQGLLPDTVSDDAGQFALEALCWVHAERLIHKLDNLHRPAIRRPAAPARWSGGSSQGLSPRPTPAGGAARPLRPDLPPPHRVRHARPAARPAVPRTSCCAC